MPALEKGSTDPNQLNEGGGTDDNLNPREFFWDSVILYLASVILALTALDAIAEYVRGTDVSCVESSGEEASGYVNTFCGGSLPSTEFVPAFLFIHGLAIAIPHILWQATYGGQFDYFFSVVKNLDQSNEKTTRKYSQENVDIVRRLEHSFTTYDRNSIYWLYLGKLLLQVVFALASLVLSVIYFTDFDVAFPCPQDINDTNSSSFPYPERVTCVFTALKFLYWIRIVDMALICIIVFAVFRGFWFCFTGHPTQLGPDKVAQFSFQSGMNPDLYLSGCPCCPNGDLLCCRLPLIAPLHLIPRIRTDLDFMLLKLYRTNAGIGKLFKDIQIEMHIQNTIEQDKIAIKLFRHKWDSGRDVDVPDGGLMWSFEDRYSKVYKDNTKKKIKPMEMMLQLPLSIRGAVLGLSSYSRIGGAMAITFNTAGYGLALSRVFKRTATVLFSDLVKEPEEKESAESDGSASLIDKLVDITFDSSSQLNVTMPENILMSESKITQEFYKKLQPIWQVDEDDRVKTSFIVVGPMSKPQATTVYLFLTQLCGSDRYLQDGCIIILLQPTRVSGETTKNTFNGLKKKPPNCAAVSLDLDIVKSNLVWPTQSPAKLPGDSSPKLGSTHQQQLQQSGGFPLEECQPTDTSKIVDPSDVEKSATQEEPDMLPQLLSLQCGNVTTEFNVCVYVFDHKKSSAAVPTRAATTGGKTQSSMASATPTPLPKVENTDQQRQEETAMIVTTTET